MEKTIRQWEEIYNVKILDPDGFDRKDPDLYKKKYTKEEFLEGLMYSTVQYMDSPFNIVKEESNDG